MSLKAYDGMMSRKSIKYIQDEIVKRLDRLKKASENQIAETIADIFVEYFDNNFSVIKNIEYHTNGDRTIKEKIDQIKIDDDKTIWSYIYQASKILSESKYTNPFTVHLNISLQAINNRKILLYPNILVNEHKHILLEFLEDWYCQNQSDPDTRVPARIWKQREKDWYNFDEVQGFSMKIKLFDPSDYWNSLVINFRGEEAIEKILKFVPSDEERIKSIAYKLVINNYKKDCEEKNIKFNYYNVSSQLRCEGNTEVEDYIKNNNIILTKIDKDCIENAKLNYNPIAEIRKEKLQEITKNNE